MHIANAICIYAYIANTIYSAMFPNAEHCNDITQNAYSAERCIELLLFPINYC